LITVVIPARMASSRFPGKPLVSIDGLPMVEHVRRRALLAPNVGKVVVATCDKKIYDCVSDFGGDAVMTSIAHERCTDRVTEAMNSLAGDIVVMVQGDEPLLNPEVINLVAKPLMDGPLLNTVNLLSPLESSGDYLNQNIVKAAVDLHSNLMFLTRAPIPFFREPMMAPIFRQTGIMAFRSSFLAEFSGMSETPLERVESIDMLRILEHGHLIRGVVASYPTVGVDIPQDVNLVEEILFGNPLQMELHKRIKG